MGGLGTVPCVLETISVSVGKHYGLNKYLFSVPVVFLLTRAFHILNMLGHVWFVLSDSFWPSAVCFAPGRLFHLPLGDHASMA